jgi:hypothetical protein
MRVFKDGVSYLRPSAGQRGSDIGEYNSLTFQMVLLLRILTMIVESHQSMLARTLTSTNVNAT